MKGEDDFKGMIRDIGCDPFFVHYHSSEQTHLYRNYCRNKNKPTLIIDAKLMLLKSLKNYVLEILALYIYTNV